MRVGQQPERVLGTADAVVIGLGSMLGAGVFTVFGPAAAAAGSWTGAALGLAALVAFANATSSAQLAAQHPHGGGTFVYGREQLGPWAGFTAGWGFVAGKSASCAAMALVVSANLISAGLLPAWSFKPGAVAVLLALVLVNLAGVSKTARLARVIVALVLAGLVLLAAGLWGSGAAQAHAVLAGPAPGPAGVLQAAGLLFFAFAGYARVATLGGEVRDPRRTIPRAIVAALGIVVGVYAAVWVTTAAVLGPERLAASSAPVADAAARLGPAAAWGAGLLAAIGAIGALLGLLAGVSRTAQAMAAAGELPRVLAELHPVRGVPQAAELGLAAVMCVLIAAADLRTAIGFSSFGVLVYYAVANAAALTQRGAHRRYPRALQWTGIIGCLALAFSLPWQSVAAGTAVFAVGLAVRAVRLRSQRKGRSRL